MGVDTKLYLNIKWDLDDVIKVIERIRDCKIKINSHDNISIGYFTLDLNNGRMVHVHSSTDTPLGHATLLSMASDNESHELFKAIAGVFGGIFVDNDCDDKCEMIMGKMWEEDGLSYFLRNAFINDNIDSHDVKGLIKSMANWYKEYNPNKMPEDLKILLREKV